MVPASYRLSRIYTRLGRTEAMKRALEHPGSPTVQGREYDADRPILGFVPDSLTIGNTQLVMVAEVFVTSYGALFATGVGLRWVINKNIVVRADHGMSPDEGMFPQFYFDGRHVY